MIAFNSLFSLDKKRLKKLQRTLNTINSLKGQMATLSNEELQAKTTEFRKRLVNGETLDDICAEAFAVVREADERVLGLFPYDVQVIGGLVLHQGNTAEMKTGEGKTLTATMPLYLNALEGKGAMLLTNNSYLAIRDAEEMGKVYRFLGLSVGVGVSDNEEEDRDAATKRAVYSSDIVYSTSSALGFDYLIDNLASSKSQKYMPKLHYVIVDEADAVLLDMAQTPLVISGSPRVQSNLYKIADELILSFEEQVDYYFDKERQEVWIKNQGVREAERYFRIPHFYKQSNRELVRHLNLSLKAHKLFERGKDYVVDDGEIKLLDATNGRVLEGTKLQGGVHQAIEQKEHLNVTPESRAMASITYQNLFRMFTKLAGMTGTGKTAEKEFIEVYDMEVVRIPTNSPVRRIDYPDKIYTTLPEKIHATIEFVKQVHDTGQPILLVAGSVRMSELFSELLLLSGIPHSLLNAQSAVKEAQMIAEAGQKGAVTVATNMAGRGTDIKLGKGVSELGGLAVIGTERMKSQRMDLQLRGRSGRQGDIGFSQFFVSFEDDLMIESGPKWAQDYFRKNRDKVNPEKPKALGQRRFQKLFQQTQEASDGKGESARSQTIEFDSSVQLQREYVYRERNALINGESGHFSPRQIIDTVISSFIAYLDGEVEKEELIFEVNRFIFDNMSYNLQGISKEMSLEEIKNYLFKIADEILREKHNLLGDSFGDFERTAALKAIDEAWIEEVDYLQQLRTVATARQTAQRNPVFEYHKEAYKSYNIMKKEIREQTFRNLLLSEVSFNENGDLQIYFI
ncbi:TPA: accessory Sec system translocase SecA2 [Streptococcus agalactiae]